VAPVEVSDDRVWPDSANQLERRHAIVRRHHVETTLLQGGLQNMALLPTNLGDDDTGGPPEACPVRPLSGAAGELSPFPLVSQILAPVPDLQR
jgi:hypothetical protein